MFHLGPHITDAGLYALSLKLKNLNRINILGNRFVRGCSIIDLSINCVFLKWIAVNECYSVSLNAFGYLLKNRPQLEALFLNDSLDHQFSNGAISFEFARCLGNLDVSHLFVLDE